MKTNCLLLIFSLSMLSNISAQNETAKWRFGVGMGANSLSLKKNWGLNTKSSLGIKGNHVGFQGNASVYYLANKHFWIISGLGVTQAESNAYRESHTESFLITEKIARYDTVMQKLILLDLPLSLRWQIVAEDNEDWNVKFFMNLGFHIYTPLKQDLMYGHREIRNQTLGSETLETSSGKLKVEPPSLLFSFGFMLSRHATIEFGWNRINTRATNVSGVRYKSRLTSLTFAWVF